MVHYNNLKSQVRFYDIFICYILSQISYKNMSELEQEHLQYICVILHKKLTLLVLVFG